MHGFQSSSCCVELGDRRVLQNEVENEQCLRRLVGRAHSDNSEPCHGGPRKLEDRPCTQHAQAHAANEAYHAEDRTQMPADRNGREYALPHSLLRTGAGSERIVNCSPADCHAVQHNPVCSISMTLGKFGNLRQFRSQI